MITINTFRKLALSLPETIEAPHFEKTSFRVRNKIFATYDKSNLRACVKLSESDQDVFCKIEKSVIYPVNNKWGKQGWTIIEMAEVEKELFKDILTTAYCTTAPGNLADLVKSSS